jgi:hypothetical protein
MKPSRKNKLPASGGFVIEAGDHGGNQSTEPHVEPAKPLPPARNAVLTTWSKTGFAVRNMVKWRATIASHVPVGYEDQTGFHYGVNPDDWSFSY